MAAYWEGRGLEIEGFGRDKGSRFRRSGSLYHVLNSVLSELLRAMHSLPLTIHPRGVIPT